MAKILMSPADDNGGGGGGAPVEGYDPGQPQADASKNQPAGAAGAAPAGDSDDGDTDEFGYKLTAEAKAERDKAKAAPADDKSKQTPAAKPDAEKPDISKVPGYGEELKEEVVPPVVPPADEKIELGYELNEKDVDPADAKVVKQFAKKHGISKEAAQDILDLRRTESLAFQKQQADAQAAAIKLKNEVRLGWQKELKADPDFGGEKYAQSIHTAMKVVDEHFPELKKDLDARKAMLPAWHMKELAKLGKLLYATPKFVQGGPNEPAPEPDNDDGLGFYK